MPDPVPASRLRVADLLPAATLGLRTRRLRAVLSMLGVAIGIAAITAVLGITASSQSNLLDQLSRLGTNMLTVANAQTVTGVTEAELPATATVMIDRLPGVTGVAPTAALGGVNVYLNQLIPSGQTSGITVRACDTSLLPALQGSVMQGWFLNAATWRYPVTVLGYQAARALGISHLNSGTRVWLGGHWFTIAGILAPLQLAPDVDDSALIGFPVAAQMFGYDRHPSRIYVRAATSRVTQVASLLAAQSDPAAPEDVSVSQPSDALTAQVAVQQSGSALFLGLGAIALLVGGIGIANVMVVAVLERRSEIGLRRALGATRHHIAVQFLIESLILGMAGGSAGVILGVGATVTMAYLRNWQTLLPPEGLWGGLGIAAVVGVAAGLYPALRAAGLAPTEALRTT